MKWIICIVAVSVIGCGDSGGGESVGFATHVGTWKADGDYCSDDGLSCGGGYQLNNCAVTPQHPATMTATTGLNALGGDFRIDGNNNAVMWIGDAPLFTFDGRYLYGSHGYNFEWIDIADGTAVIVYKTGCALKYRRV